MPEAPPWVWQYLLELGEREWEWDVAFSSADPLPRMLFLPVEIPFGIFYRKPARKSQTSSLQFPGQHFCVWRR